jgi:hypothetical protein
MPETGIGIETNLTDLNEYFYRLFLCKSFQSIGPPD